MTTTPFSIQVTHGQRPGIARVRTFAGGNPISTYDIDARDHIVQVVEGDEGLWLNAWEMEGLISAMREARTRYQKAECPEVPPATYSSEYPKEPAQPEPNIVATLEKLDITVSDLISIARTLARALAGKTQ